MFNVFNKSELGKKQYCQTCHVLKKACKKAQDWLVHGSAMFFRAIDWEVENIPENKCQNTSLLPPRKLHVGSR